MGVNRKATYYVENRVLKNNITEKSYICIKCNARMVRDSKPQLRGGIWWMVTGLFCKECENVVEDGPGEIMGSANGPNF